MCYKECCVIKFTVIKATFQIYNYCQCHIFISIYNEHNHINDKNYFMIVHNRFFFHSKITNNDL